MSINRTVVKTWTADVPRASVQAKTLKEARAKIRTIYGRKRI